MLKEYIIFIFSFTIGIFFILFWIIQGYYITRLNNLFKIKYKILHESLIWIDFGFALYIPRPIRLMKYIWFEKSYPKDIAFLIKKVRLFQKLVLLPPILLIITLFIIEFIFQYIMGAI